MKNYQYVIIRRITKKVRQSLFGRGCTPLTACTRIFFYNKPYNIAFNRSGSPPVSDSVRESDGIRSHPAVSYDISKSIPSARRRKGSGRISAETGSRKLRPRKGGATISTASSEPSALAEDRPRGDRFCVSCGNCAGRNGIVRLTVSKPPPKRNTAPIRYDNTNCGTMQSVFCGTESYAIESDRQSAKSFYLLALLFTIPFLAVRPIFQSSAGRQDFSLFPILSNRRDNAYFIHIGHYADFIFYLK